MRKSRRNTSNTNSLTLGDRNSRLLLVISTIGLLIYVYKFLSKLNSNIFNSLYINRRIPVGTEHLLSLNLVNCLLIIIIVAIAYCFSEYFNFCEYTSPSLKIQCSQRSDMLYKFLFGTIQVNFFILVSNTFLFSIFFDDFQIEKIITFISLIFIVIFFFKFYCNKVLVYFFPPIFKIRNWILIILLVWSVLFFMIFAFTTQFLSIGLKEDSTIDFCNNKGVSVDMHFANKKPTQIKLLIKNKQDTKNIILKEDEVQSMGVTVCINDTNAEDSSYKNKKALYKQSRYGYFVSKEIKDYLIEGKNIVTVFFVINDGTTSKEYTVNNEIILINNKANILENKFKINF